MDQFIKQILLLITLASFVKIMKINTEAIKYGYTNLGLAPSFVV
jgi:hypothetical protein